MVDTNVRTEIVSDSFANSIPCSEQKTCIKPEWLFLVKLNVLRPKCKVLKDDCLREGKNRDFLLCTYISVQGKIQLERWREKGFGLIRSRPFHDRRIHTGFHFRGGQLIKIFYTEYIGRFIFLKINQKSRIFGRWGMRNLTKMLEIDRKSCVKK